MAEDMSYGKTNFENRNRAASPVSIIRRLLQILVDGTSHHHLMTIS